MDSVARARNLRRNSTDAERKLWRMLRARQFQDYKFRRQKPIGPYIADFVCMAVSLIVEADGSQHLEQQSSYDAERDSWLHAKGYRVLRFTNLDILNEPEAVASRIMMLLEASQTEPSP